MFASGLGLVQNKYEHLLEVLKSFVSELFGTAMTLNKSILAPSSWNILLVHVHTLVYASQTSSVSIVIPAPSASEKENPEAFLRSRTTSNSVLS